MIYTAHVHNQEHESYIAIADDRGLVAATVSMTSAGSSPAKAQLRDKGWVPSAAWTRTPDAWQAPIVSDEQPKPKHHANNGAVGSGGKDQRE